MRKPSVSQIDQGKGECKGKKGGQHDSISEVFADKRENPKKESGQHFASKHLRVNGCPAVSANALVPNPGPQRNEVEGRKSFLTSQTMGGRSQDRFPSGNPVSQYPKKTSPNQPSKNVTNFLNKTGNIHGVVFT
jgi:hypothetical protein